MDDIERAAELEDDETREDDVFAEDTSPDPNASHPDAVAVDKTGQVPPRLPKARQPDSVRGTAPTKTDTEEQRLAGLRLQDYTRKTQELAQQRREVERLQQQLLTKLADIDGRHSQPREEKQPSFLDLLDPTYREALAPETKQALSAIGQAIDARIAAMQQSFGSGQSQEMQTRLAQIEQQVQVSRQAQLAQAWGAQAQELRQQFGAEVFDTYAPHVSEILANAPNLSVKQAFLMVAPDVVQNHYIELGRRQALKKKQTADAANFVQGGSPSPSGESAPGYKAGESMRRSAEAVMGGVSLPEY